MKNETRISREPGGQALSIIREFDAPRELLFRAYTEAELMKQWLGSKGYEMVVEIFDPYAGGRYRYIHTDGKGGSYAFRGVFHDVTAPESIIQTFEFEGAKGHVSLETATFEALPGNRSRVTALSVFQSVADLDMMLRSEMERGVKEGFERLDELFAKGIA